MAKLRRQVLHQGWHENVSHVSFIAHVSAACCKVLVEPCFACMPAYLLKSLRESLASHLHAALTGCGHSLFLFTRITDGSCLSAAVQALL
jgi:hypothetical protein